MTISPEAVDHNANVEQSFLSALQAVRNSPSSEATWTHLEELGEQIQQPERVAKAYVEVLDSIQDSETLSIIAQRCVQFHDEWFGDDSERLAKILTNITQRDPHSDWAFDRLSTLLTSDEQWEKLLESFDQRIESTKDPAMLSRLLNDAAQIAKDFAGQTDRAIAYFNQLLNLDPSNNKLAASLERLIERQERWNDLIAIWEIRIPTLSPKDRREHLIRIASCYLDKLSQPKQALDILQQLINDMPTHEGACQVLKKILVLENISYALRQDTLNLLRTSYEVSEQFPELVSAIEKVLEFSNNEQAPSLHREAGHRLGILGRDEQAIKHYAKLLHLDVSDAYARLQLSLLADRSELHQDHARALVDAARQTSDPLKRVGPLVEAANVYADKLNEYSTSIELLTEVLETSQSDPATQLSVAYQLDGLLARANLRQDRLAVLERLVELERSVILRMGILEQLATLAEELGDADRVIWAWNQRLEENNNDLIAHQAIIRTFERGERWPELVDTLVRRSAIQSTPEQKRSDLIRSAQIVATKLEDTDRATSDYLQIVEDFGVAHDLLEPLDRLLSSSERWQELADLYQQLGKSDLNVTISSWIRLGDLFRIHLNQPDLACEYYGYALGINPQVQAARDGLHELLTRDSCRAVAVQRLVKSYTETNDWQKIYDLLDIRLELEASPLKKSLLLCEAAEQQETLTNANTIAMNLYCQAWRLRPDSSEIEHHILRLANENKLWTEALEAASQTAELHVENRQRAANLFALAGRLASDHLDDRERTTHLYARAVEFDPDNITFLRHLLISASQSQMWEIAAKSAIGLGIATGDPSIGLDILEQQGEISSAWSSLSESVRLELESKEELDSHLQYAWNLRLSSWYFDRLQNTELAEAFAMRALENRPEELVPLQLLAQIRRSRPDRSLVETLLSIDAQLHGDIEISREAAEVGFATENLDLATIALENLFNTIQYRWLASHDQPSTNHHCSEHALWALEHLTKILLDTDQELRAANLLLVGSRLPFEQATRRKLKKQSVELLVRCEKFDFASNILVELFNESPDDADILASLAKLYTEKSLIPELLGLRVRQLKLCQEGEKKLQLRLEISTLVGQLEVQGGRVEALLTNLEEHPGHEASLVQINSILEERGQESYLLDILRQQATLLEDNEQSEQAAALWFKIADIAETRLQDGQQAVTALNRAAELHCTRAVVDSLARMYLEHDAPATAAIWLQKRIEMAQANEIVALQFQLARACVRANNSEQAIIALESIITDAPKMAEARKLLLNLYRERKSWSDLVRVMTFVGPHVSDQNVLLNYARESAEVCRFQLKQPGLSLPLLTLAAEIVPEDRKINLDLARALQDDDQFDRAEQILREVIESFGRRRSQDRAAVHLQLAAVLRDQQQYKAALEQLETAANMDSSNPEILSTLAELAFDRQEFDRAERAYRTLLLQSRQRGKSANLATPWLASSAIQFKLCQIAEQRGDSEQAEELFESCLESAMNNASEAEELQSLLHSTGSFDRLEKVVRARIKSCTDNKPEKAKLFAEMAGILNDAREDYSASFDSWIKAIELDPSLPAYHDAAIVIAEQLSKEDQYVSHLESLLQTAQAESNKLATCELCLRLAQVYESSLDNPKQAKKLLQIAKDTDTREIDVWRALARVCGTLGETEEQTDLLEKLANAGADDQETRCDALFRLAEVQLARADDVGMGLDNLRLALNEQSNYTRAGNILKQASQFNRTHDGFLELFEQVSRSCSDDLMLLSCLELRAENQFIDPERLHEAIALAKQLELYQKVEDLLLTTAKLVESSVFEPMQVSWCFIGLTRLRLQEADLAGTVKWFAQACEWSDLEELIELAHQIEERAREQGDLTLAIKAFEKLFERDPMTRLIYTALSDLYIELGDISRLQSLVEQTIDGLIDSDDRNELRLKLVHAKLNHKHDPSEVTELLQAVLLEDPENSRANEFLETFFEQTDQTSDLLELLQRRLMNAQTENKIPEIKRITLKLGDIYQEQDPNQALATYRNILEVLPNDIELLQRSIALLDDEEDIRDRAELMERLVFSNDGPLDSEMLFATSACYQQCDDPDSAMRIIEKAYEQHPDSSELRQHLLESYEQSNNYLAWAQLLVKSVEFQSSDSEKSETLKSAANLYRNHLDNEEEALKLLKAAADTCPEDLDLLLEVTELYHTEGKTEAAIELLTREIDRRSDAGLAQPEQSARLLSLRSELRSDTGDSSGSLEDLELAFGHDPEQFGGPYEQQISALIENARQQEDSETEQQYLTKLIDLQLTSDRDDEAIETIGQWIQRNPQDAAMIRQLQRLAGKNQRWPEVIRACNLLMELESIDQQLTVVRCLFDAATALDSISLARQGLELALHHHAEDPWLRRALREIYQKDGAKKELAYLVLGDAATCEDPKEQAEQYKLAGQLFLDAGEPQASMRALTTAYQLLPEDTDLAISLIDAYLLSQNIEEAEKIVDDAIKAQKRRRSPAMAALQHRKSRLCGAHNDMQAQLNWLQEAYTSDRNNYYVAAELADIAQNLEQWDLATRVLRNISMLDDGQCSISRLDAYARQAEIWHHLGDTRKAAFWAHKAKNLAPEDPYILQLCATISDGSDNSKGK